MIREQAVHEIMIGILEADPIPFQNVNMNGPDVYKLIFASVWEMYQTQWKSINRDETEEIMLASVIKLICENFYLHTKLLMLGEGE